MLHPRGEAGQNP